MRAITFICSAFAYNVDQLHLLASIAPTDVGESQHSKDVRGYLLCGLGDGLDDRAGQPVYNALLAAIDSGEVLYIGESPTLEEAVSTLNSILSACVSELGNPMDAAQLRRELEAEVAE